MLPCAGKALTVKVTRGEELRRFTLPSPLPADAIGTLLTTVADRFDIPIASIQLSYTDEV